MSEPAKSATPSDGPITIETTTVACAGKGDTSGHPKVYIKIDPSIGTADCPYCAQTFQLDPNADLSGHH